MKSSLLAKLLPLLASATFAGSASAVTVLIDFGNPGAAAASPYNIVAHAATVALNDTASTAMGWSVNATSTGSGTGGNAGAGANVSTFPAALLGFDANALKDSIFANQGAGTAPSLLLTFSGLNPAANYDILLYGSRGNGQSLDQQWSVTQGIGGAAVTHPSGLNDTVHVDWMGVTPTAGGVIEILLDVPAGGTNAGALALNFGSITEVVPEPSAALLCAFSCLALFSRRRR
jgi:hypothetical protein